MTRIKLTIEYDGTPFCGYQSQKNGNTVQDFLETALKNYLGESVRIYSAGRTDVGVHARCQTVHFDTAKEVNCFNLCLGVNLLLPAEIAVTNAEKVDDSFDARFSAVSKTYCYRIYVSAVRRPLFRTTYAQFYKPLDVQAMRNASTLMVGTHDFKAFQKSGSNLKGTVRTVNSIDILQNGDTLEFWINGNAFLYNQVRIMVGLLVAVGSGKKTLADVSAMLDGTRTNVKTMPSCGLTLEKVFY